MHQIIKDCQLLGACNYLFPSTESRTPPWALIEGGERIFSQKYTLTVTEEMHKRLEEERKRRFLHSISETIRMILSEYLSSTGRDSNER